VRLGTSAIEQAANIKLVAHLVIDAEAICHVKSENSSDYQRTV